MMPRSRSGPTLLAFVICDTVLEDVETGKKSLIGLFDLVVGFEAPAHVPELCVYVCLAGGPEHSPCTIRVRCVAPDNTEVASAEETVHLPEKNSVAELVFRFQGLAFLRPGWYRFVCEADGRLLAERSLLVELESV